MWGSLRRSGIPLFTVRGISVQIHPSIALFWIFVGGSLASTRFFGRYPALPPGTITAMIMASLVLAELSILLHEFGHSFRARREGLQADIITLWGLGGVSWSSGARTPGSDFRIVLAGPLVSLALALLLGGLGWLGHRIGMPAPVEGVVVLMAQFNAVTLAYNLIPMVPLDGGRLVKAGLWRWRGLSFAHAWASGLGIAVASGVLAFAAVAPFFGFQPVVNGNNIEFALLINGAIMLYMTTRYRSTYRPRTGGRRLMVVGDLLEANPDREPARHDLRVADFLAAAAGSAGYGSAARPVVDHGKTVGAISRGLAALVPEGERDLKRVGEVMLRPEDAVALKRETPIRQAFDLLQADRGRGVITHRGRVTAIILASDLADVILRWQDRERGVAPAGSPSHVSRR